MKTILSILTLILLVNIVFAQPIEFLNQPRPVTTPANDRSALSPDHHFKLMQEAALKNNRTGSFSMVSSLDYNLEWARYFSGSLDASSTEQAQAIICDQAGNVYVAGLQTTAATGTDVYIAKLSPNGALLWQKLEDYGMQDEVLFIALDNAGNVYIAGNGMGKNGDWDVLLYKFTASGAKVYASVYDGQVAASEQIHDMVVDPEGNTYLAVHGSSTGPNWDTDYITCKFDPQGRLLWKAVYNGPSGFEEIRQIAIDKKKNVYVTGNSFGVDSNSDYATIKYSADGRQLWVARYTSAGDQIDVSNAVTVDSSGNVYVSGHSDPTGVKDCITIKYDSTGKQLWMDSMNGSGNGNDQARDIQYDGRGAVYVAGETDGAVGKTNLFVIKYDTAGTKLWQKEYDNQGRAEYHKGLAVDTQGNCIVIGQTFQTDYTLPYQGSDYVVVKFDAVNGDFWQYLYDGFKDQDNALALATDANADILVTGWSVGNATVTDIATIKISAAGSLLWTQRMDGPSIRSSSAGKTALDSHGNILIVGSDDGKTASEMAVLKYNEQGVLVWQRNIPTPGYYYDTVKDLGFDKSDNLIVVGAAVDEQNSSDIRLAKLDPAGQILWNTVLLDGLGQFSPAALAEDDSGNVYLACHGRMSGNADELAVFKCNDAGQLKWQQSYTGPGSGSDQAVDIICSPKAVYVFGNVRNSSRDIVLLKYDHTGRLLWDKSFDGVGAAKSDKAVGFVIDSAEHIYIAGSCINLSSNSDMALVKFDSSGALLWQQWFNGDFNGEDYAAKICLDGDGNVYLAGTTQTGSSEEKWLILKYNADGLRQWQTALTVQDYVATSGILPSGLAIDQDGHIWMSGLASFNNYLSRYDCGLVRINAAGEVVGSEICKGRTDYFRSVSLMVDAKGQIYITGTEFGNGWSDIAVFKYQKTTFNVTRTDQNMPAEYVTLTNYPNPFNPSTTIYYNLNKAERVTLAIYNITGQKVAFWDLGIQQPAEHRLIWDAIGMPSGLYFCRLRGSDFAVTRKILLQK